MSIDEGLFVTETRHARYDDLTALLRLDTPNSFLDILTQIDRSHPPRGELGEKLRGLRGKRFDFIGAGITGVMSAYVAGELSRMFDLGWETHVWDQYHCAGGKATKDSAARTRTSMFGTEKETIGNLAGTLFFENFTHVLKQGAREAGVDFPFEPHAGLRRCGYLWLFRDNTAQEAVRKNLALLQQLNSGKIQIPAFVLEPAQVKKMMPRINPDRFRFAYLCPTDAYVEPTSIVDALERYNREVLRVQFHYGAKVCEIMVDAKQPLKFYIEDKNEDIENRGTAPRVEEGEERREEKRCSGWQETYFLGITTGAASKVLGEQIKIGGRESGLVRQLTPKYRQLTFCTYDEETLRELDPFTIFVGQGAYFSRDGRHGDKVMFGFARPSDEESDARSVIHEGYWETRRNDESHLNFFMERMLAHGENGQSEGELLGLHEALQEERIVPVQHRGNFYGETADGNYLVGVLDRAREENPQGVLGINAGDNGHGIMASLGTAVHLVYRLTGVLQQEFAHWNPNRDTTQQRAQTQRL